MHDGCKPSSLDGSRPLERAAMSTYTLSLKNERDSRDKSGEQTGKRANEIEDRGTGEMGVLSRLEPN